MKKAWVLNSHWAHSEDSGQTGRIPRLIWVFAWRTYHYFFFFFFFLFFFFFFFFFFFMRWLIFFVCMYWDFHMFFFSVYTNEIIFKVNGYTPRTITLIRKYCPSSERSYTKNAIWVGIHILANKLFSVGVISAWKCHLRMLSLWGLAVHKPNWTGLGTVKPMYA